MNALMNTLTNRRWASSHLAALLAVAVVFGAVPAYRASLLNPSEALHHE